MQDPAHELRRHAVELVVHREPGCSLRDVARGVGISMRHAKAHVAWLERHRGLVVGRATDQWFLFPAGTVIRDAAVARALADAKIRKLWKWLRGLKVGLNQTMITSHAASEWGWPESTTRWRLNRLVHVGLLVQVPNGRKEKLHFPTEEP